MRKFTTVAALVVGLGVAGVCFAKGNKTAGVATTPKKSKSAQEVSPASITEQATIAKIDGATVTLTLQIVADSGTKVMVDGQIKTLADLKAGQTASVTFSGSNLTAITIAAPAAKPAADPATPPSATPAPAATPVPAPAAAQ